MMSPAEVKHFLDSLVNYESVLNSFHPSSSHLERIEYLLALSGHPQKKIKFVHVAGTNGKGSVCAFTASVLQKAGYRVGLYTSPHLSDHKERIRILDRRGGAGEEGFSGQITDDEFCGIVDDLRPKIEKVHSRKEWGALTLFEIYTAIAFCYFKSQAVDIGVLEAGLGGRFDATNAADSLVCGITPISLDHVRQLGPTVEAIAREKAAIIKNSKQRVVLAPQEPPVEEILRRRCQEFHIDPLVVGRDIRFQKVDDGHGQKFILQRAPAHVQAETQLLGRHQMINAATAFGIIESLRELKWTIDQRSFVEGVRETVWPGRFERIGEGPLIVLDGAHNSSGAQALAQTVKEHFPRKRIILILGLSKDKDQAGFCGELNKVAHSVIVTRSAHPRALPPEDFSGEQFSGGKPVFRTKTVAEAIALAKQQASPDDMILITGSLFVVGEARKKIFAA